MSITPLNYHTECELFIRSRPYDPNHFGVVLKPDMPEWDEWQRYFARKGLEAQRSFMRSRWANGYTVPCRKPEDFDPSIRPQQARTSDRPEAAAGSLSQRATPSQPRRETRIYNPSKGEAA